MNRSRSRIVAMLLVMAALIAACGSGRRSEQGAPETKTTTVAANGSFGDLSEVCGPGDASGATDQGVTDTEITIGYGDDAGYPQTPGHQMADAMKAFINWCNDAGGINGRKVKGNYHDAKLFDVNNAVLDSCKTDFFLVGQGFALDASQEENRRACGLPSVPGYAVSPQFSNGPLVWSAFAVPADYTNTYGAVTLAEMYPDKIAKTAAVFGNFSATIDSKDKVESAWPSHGYTFMGCDQQYNIAGEADWKPIMQRLKDCGAEIVYFVGSPAPSFENALTAAAQLDYKPIWWVDANFYDQAFAQWNADGFADNVYLWTAYTPLEEASSNPATQQYVDILKKYGGEMNQLGQQASSAFLLWATAAKACGSNLTRACMGEQLDKITTWTGGGLHAPANPGENLPSECGSMLQIQGQAFVRVKPTTPGTFECDPSYATKTSGPVLERAKLDANRVSGL